MPVPGLFVVQPTTCLAQLIWQSSLRCHWLLSSSPSPRCHLMRWVIPLLWRSLISLLCCEFCKLRLDRVFFFSHLEMQYCIRKKIFCLEIELFFKKANKLWMQKYIFENADCLWKLIFYCLFVPLTSFFCISSSSSHRYLRLHLLLQQWNSYYSEPDLIKDYFSGKSLICR